MNRVRLVKKDYQKLIRAMPQDHPPQNIENRYAHHEVDHSPDEHRTICYTMGVYRDKPHNQQMNMPSGKQLFKKHILQNERLFGEADEASDSHIHHIKSFKKHQEPKRIKTLQRSIEMYNQNEQRSDKLKRKDIRALSNPRKDTLSKVSPYVKRLNRQSLNVSRERTRTNLQSSGKIMRHLHDSQRSQELKTGTMSEMKIVDRRGPTSRLRDEELLERGKRAYQQNKFSLAVQILLQLLSRQPTHLQCNYLIAVSLMGRNEFARAIRHFDTILQTDPSYNKNVYILYAICCKRLSLSEQSIKKLTQCIELHPDYYDAYIYRGKLRIKQKKLSEAISDFIKANQINNERPHGYVGLAQCFYNVKEDQKAYEMFSRAMKLEPSVVTSPLCLKIVTSLIEMGKEEDALSILSSVTKMMPNNPQALMLKGNIHTKQKKYNEAIMTYDQVMKINDKKWNTMALQAMIRARICERDFYSAYHLLQRIEYVEVDRQILDKIRMFTEAVLFLMKRKFNESIEIFEEMGMRYVMLQTRHDVSQMEAENDSIDYFLKPLFHLYSAYGYFCLSNYQKASDQYTVYHQILKNRKKQHKILESSHYNQIVCQALILTYEQKYEQALKRLDQASAIYAHKVQPYIYKGIIQVKRGAQNEKHYQQALQMFTKGVEVLGDVSNNTISNVYYHRAVVYAYQATWNEAIQDIDKAIEKSEDNIPKYFYLRGLAFACCQSFKQAIHDLSVCITLNEHYAEAFLMRSKCLQIQGEANEAFIDLQRYISRDFGQLQASFEARGSSDSQVCWTSSLLKWGILRQHFGLCPWGNPA